MKVINFFGKKTMKVRAKKYWRWSWIVTLPISIIYIYWAWNTLDRYYTFALRYNSGPMPVKLLILGKSELVHLKNKFRTSVTEKMLRNDTAKEGLRTINLFIPEPDLASLNSNLPYSGFKYVKGRLFSEGKLLKVKVKYRGDFVYHWGYYKKSLRIKTKKSRLFEGMHSFNLIAPKSTEQLRTFLSYRLASIMGLVTPRVEMVNVTINGKSQGLYTLVEQLNESTLRNNQLMPGDLYKGELMGKDYYTGSTGLVFDHPSLWAKAAVNNHYPPESRKPLEHFIKLLNLSNSPDEKKREDGVKKFSSFLNMDTWGRFNAFEILTHSVHYDPYHNWRLYYDPARSHFIPIVWDPYGWAPFWLPKEGQGMDLTVSSTRLHKALNNNGTFLRARHQAIRDFFKSGSDKIFLNEVGQVVKDIEPYIYNDPNLIAMTQNQGFFAGDPQEVMTAIRQLRENIKKVFTEVRKGYLSKNGNVSYFESKPNKVLSILITGRRPVYKLSINYLAPFQDTVSAKIRYWRNGQKKEVDISGAVSQNGTNIQVSTNLLPQSSNVTGNQPTYYELLLKGIPRGNKLIEVQADRGGNGFEQAQHIGEIKRRSFMTMNNVINPEPLPKPIIWSGVVEISSVQEVNSELIIKPGTTILLKPGASLILHKRLFAEGTPEKPIRFFPAGKSQEPWGAIVLKGRGANNSVLSYCNFKGGSGLKDDLFEYSAMFSVHDVLGVRVNNSIFSNSKSTDDMVHAVYSDIKFNESTFIQAYADALDLDMSSTTIENCRFTNSGNDAIDLMTSKAVLIDTIIENSGDKGVSVGEGAQLVAINNRLKGNLVGVQSKDSSIAVLYNVDLSENGRALDAYKKNWRYGGGGKIFLYKGHLSGNKEEIKADKKSLIKIYDSFNDRTVKAGNKRIAIDKTVDSEKPEKAKEGEFWRFPEEIATLEGFKKDIWIKADPSRRGYKNVTH
ncbi:MAG: CotH kinase family protein [Proteobacteria bacterium]|nr:CotH kinase family protein [Pseudomonadota bacterium]